MNVVVILDKKDSSYSYKLRDYLQGCNIKTITQPITLITLVKNACEEHKSKLVITTSLPLLKKLVNNHDPHILDKDIKLGNYRGSVFYIDDIRVLILPSPKLLNFVADAPFLFNRWIQKLTNPNFPVFPKLDWIQLSPDNIDRYLEKAKTAIAMGVDIETARKPFDIRFKDDPLAAGMWTMGPLKKGSKKIVPIIPIITTIGWSCLYRNENGELYSETYVLRITSMTDILYMRMFNATEAFKIFQNGGYDHTYLLRYGAPCTNYLGDTFVAMHAYLAELPRNLAFITSLFDRDYIFWKDEADNNLLEYNAKDCHNTLWDFIYMWLEMPEWAKNNYLANFKMQFPCITVGLEGFKCDEKEQKRLLDKEQKILDAISHRASKIITPGFNPNSPPQVLKLLHGLGYKKAKSSDVHEVQAFMDTHPLFEVIGGIVKSYRKSLKAISTYFTIRLLNGRILYEQNPAATDTGRLNSSESNLWCGTNIQNQPYYSKSMFIADTGWRLNAVDYAQSESYCTGFISEDRNLLRTLGRCFRGEGDFHQINGSLFFGVPESEIVGSMPGDLRWISKKVNHGANYNMGWLVLLQTMTRKHVMKAREMLKLPRSMSVKQVCEFLLDKFDKAYPDIRGKYYNNVIREVQQTGMLVSATGWVRRCFGNPEKAKHILNSYVAHGPQCLSVKNLNTSFFDAWLQLQIIENKIRLKCQVHDEIVWQCKPEDIEYTTKVIRDLMERPLEVNGRQMIIPTDAVTGKLTWAECKD